jgi:hypothetical protein
MAGGIPGSVSGSDFSKKRKHQFLFFKLTTYVVYK